MVSVTPRGREDIILTSNKPVVVLLSIILAEGRDDGSGIRPLEDGSDGVLVQDTDGESKYEFDTVNEAKEFVKSQEKPDDNPIDARILEFRNGKWEVAQ
jgi:hypothetical protein